jgi:hypothetical protein
MQDTTKKITKIKRDGGMAQMVELLSSKHKALSSNLISYKKKKKVGDKIMLGSSKTQQGPVSLEQNGRGKDGKKIMPGSQHGIAHVGS